jgi:hypothetical protein
MTRTRQKNRVEVVFLDQPIQMDVDQAHTGVRTPVTEQADLGVFNLQGLFQERVIS